MPLATILSTAQFSWLAFFATLVALNASNERAVPSAAQHCYEDPTSPDCVGRVLGILLSGSAIATLGGYVVGLQGGPDIGQFVSVGASRAGVVGGGEGVVETGTGRPGEEGEMNWVDGVALALPVLWLLGVLAAIIGGRFKVSEPTWVTRGCVSFLERVKGVRSADRAEPAGRDGPDGRMTGKTKAQSGVRSARKRK